MFRIRAIDGLEYADELAALHREIFEREAPQPDFYGHWWLVWYGGEIEPVGFAGLVESTIGPRIGYLKRAGVLPLYRGGLQARLIRVREKQAKRMGWKTLVTDTHENIHSSNNLIAAGYRLFEPELRWSFKDALYWRKDL